MDNTTLLSNRYERLCKNHLTYIAKLGKRKLSSDLSLKKQIEKFVSELRYFIKDSNKIFDKVKRAKIEAYEQFWLEKLAVSGNNVANRTLY